MDPFWIVFLLSLAGLAVGAAYLTLLGATATAVSDWLNADWPGITVIILGIAVPGCLFLAWAITA